MKSKHPKLALAAVLVLVAPPGVLAATCSCAGTPLLASIDTSAREKGQLFLTYSSEFHQISDLVNGSRDVTDETDRDRHSLSQVISASYAITDRWAVSALISWVEHNRRIGSSFIGETSTSGFGDSMLLALYTPVAITPFSRHELSLGLGTRIPTGEDEARSEVILSEDMQPSVGATGAIAWTSYSYAFNQAATKQLNLSANYLQNGENDRQYSFGDEFNFAVGFSHNLNTRFAYSGALRYRSAQSDRRSGFAIPNTGGQWLDFVPALQYSINDRLRMSVFGRLPVARELNGSLQFSTSYSYGLSLSYGF